MKTPDDVERFMDGWASLALDCSCEWQRGDPLADALREVMGERDEARARITRLKHECELREAEQERIAGILHQEAQRRAAAEAARDEARAFARELISDMWGGDPRRVLAALEGYAEKYPWLKETGDERYRPGEATGGGAG